MIASKCDFRAASEVGGSPEERMVVEFNFLLPRNYLSVLDRLAEANGMTVACLLRRVIQDYLLCELKLLGAEAQPLTGTDSRG
jgi:hypothetical protein